MIMMRVKVEPFFICVAVAITLSMSFHPSNGTVEVVEVISGNLWGPGDSPPLDSEAIKHISSALTQDECQATYDFLVSRDSAEKMHKTLHTFATFKAMNSVNVKGQEQRRNPDRDPNFNCRDSLRYWNEELLGEYAKEMPDKSEIAERVLKAALRSTGRKDLATWLKSFMKTKSDQEIADLEKELESHKVQYWNSKTVMTERSSEDSSHGAYHITFLMAFVVLAFTISITLCLLINNGSKNAKAMQIPLHQQDQKYHWLETAQPHSQESRSLRKSPSENQNRHAYKNEKDATDEVKPLIV